MRKLNSSNMAAMALMLATGGSAFPWIREQMTTSASGPVPEKVFKCLLPGCDKPATPNKGYCCAEHCRSHRSCGGH